MESEGLSGSSMLENEEEVVQNYYIFIKAASWLITNINPMTVSKMKPTEIKKWILSFFEKIPTIINNNQNIIVPKKPLSSHNLSNKVKCWTVLNTHEIKWYIQNLILTLK